MQSEAAQSGAVLGDQMDVSRDDGVECLVGGGVEAGGDADAEALHTAQVRFLDARLPVCCAAALRGVVEGVAGVEEGERFGVDGLACLEDRVVENLVRPWSVRWCDVVEAAQRTILNACERVFVDGEADFGR